VRAGGPCRPRTRIGHAWRPRDRRFAISGTRRQPPVAGLPVRTAVPRSRPPRRLRGGRECAGNCHRAGSHGSARRHAPAPCPARDAVSRPPGRPCPHHNAEPSGRGGRARATRKPRGRVDPAGHGRVARARSACTWAPRTAGTKYRATTQAGVILTVRLTPSVADGWRIFDQRYERPWGGAARPPPGHPKGLDACVPEPYTPSVTTPYLGLARWHLVLDAQLRRRRR